MMTSCARAAPAAIFALALALALAASPSWASRLTLNDTGMTECIDHHGEWSLDCSKSRQDAAYGRDVHDANPDDGVAGFSFRKVCHSGQMAGEGNCPTNPELGTGPNDWGCTYDNVSHLTWEIKTSDGGIHDRLRTYTNKGRKARTSPSDAAWLVDATNAEAMCGATNWRLPDALELQSIVDYGVGAPDISGLFIDPMYFPNTAIRTTWTSVTSFFDSKDAWYVSFGDGGSSVEQRFEENSARLVHEAPRSFLTARLPKKDRFVLSVDGTEVTDTMTGLVWQRCAAGMYWNEDAQACDGTATRFQWKEALDYAKANKEGGWRIPNVKELFSLVDPETPSPSIDHLAFPNTPSSLFFSSTPLDSAGRLYFKLVSFFRGYVEQQEAFNGNSWSLRLVRRGRK